MGPLLSGADRWIRWTTTASVVLLAGIAAIVSYRHMHTLTLEHGESRWTAALIPVSVDGMIIAPSMTLLADSRAGQSGGLLPWALLATSSTASLAANVAVAESTLYGRVIAAWPSFALIGAYERLMRQVRHAAEAEASARRLATEREGAEGVAAGAGSGEVVLAGGRSSTVGPGPFMSPERSGHRRGVRRLDADLLARTRQVDTEHWAQHGRPASAETLRVRLRIGTASARHLKDVIRRAPTASGVPPTATLAG